MGGRPPIVGLLAVAVALSLGGAATAPRAVAEIRIPLPGADAKPKVQSQKRYVRPTVPRRNPIRVTAGISAAAQTPPQGKDGEASAAAGLSSSSNGVIALALAPRGDSASEVARLDQTQVVADREASADDTAIESGEAAPEPGDAAAAPDEPVQTVAAEPSEEEQPAGTESAGAEKPAEEEETTAAAEAEEAPVAAAGETPVETAEAVQAETAEALQAVAAADAPAAEAALLAPVADVAAAAESPGAAALAAHAEPMGSEPAAEVPGEAEGASIAEAEAAPSAPLVTAALPSHDATVVIQISPPPETGLAATESEIDEADEAEREETQTAALTPPEVTAPSPSVEAEEETPETTQLDTAPDPAREGVDPDAARAEDEGAPDGDTASSEPATDEATADDASAEPEAAQAEDGEAPDGDAASSESVTDEAAADDASAEPEPVIVEKPPAHPVVAAIREQLADPGLGKDVAASDLEALKAFYEDREGPPLWIGDAGFSSQAKAIIAEIGKADDWGLEARSFDLPSASAAPETTDAQAAAEIKLSIAILGYARDAQIGRLTPARVSNLFDQHPSLRDPKAVLAEIGASSDGASYLIALHPQHDQFKRLRQALLRARADAQAKGTRPGNDRDVQLITINMERWRWMPRQMGNYYVWNNVPEFNVRVLKGGRTIYEEKTIVGQVKYATPFFSAPMRNIVFHPNWTVPPTIIREDLAPKLQGPGGGGFFGNSKENILRRYGLEVSHKGQRISADSVDWNNVNVHAYTFTQAPGPANVLGQFKFNFPNKHAIYMHDTPQRELFAQTTRTLSHGCIRVNQPDRLAALLLGEDKGWSMAQVRNLVARGPSSSTVISFNRHVTVHLTYFTAVVDESGRLNRFSDIYNIDNRMAPRLFDNPASFPVPATPAVAEAPARDQGRRARQTGGLDGFISGLFGN